MKDQGRRYDVLRRPVISEKSANMGELGAYVFRVSSDATKHDIASAVEDIFSVDVKKVNVMNYSPRAKVFKGRKGTRSGFKKAIVFLADGQSLDFGV